METPSPVNVAGREVEERLARCVSVMAFYKAEGRSWFGVRLLLEEARSLADWAWRCPEAGDLQATLLGPLGRELVALHGEEEGRELQREFFRAYRVASEVRPEQ